MRDHGDLDQVVFEGVDEGAEDPEGLDAGEVWWFHALPDSVLEVEVVSIGEGDLALKARVN